MRGQIILCKIQCVYTVVPIYIKKDWSGTNSRLLSLQLFSPFSFP